MDKNTSTSNTSTTTMTNNNENTNASSVLIDLQIKSLEQRTHSVTVPHVESGRQRLIFQGKVLKDDKNLMDYANLIMERSYT
ncbi:unnamed protein product [Cunninghamella echinulata]